MATLNQILMTLWPVAYPGTKVPVARRPTEAELRYAMTDPLDDQKQRILPDGTRITAKFNTYSGANIPVGRNDILTQAQEQELSQHVVHGKS